MTHPNCRCFVVPMPGAWPANVLVPPPVMRGRMVKAPEGFEEGDLCLITYGAETCMGKLELCRNDDLGGCTCWINAPCSSCMSQVPQCTECGHRQEEPF